MRCVVALVAALCFVVGCGSTGTPVEPAPVGSVQPPVPANVGGADENGAPPGSDTCNARASLPPTSGLDAPPGSTMDEIRKRGKLIVGVDQTTYLFGFRNPTSGKLEGFDIDMARQVAKALFGNEDAIQFKAITSAQRVPALQNHQVDIVVRTMTVNCERRKDINFSSVYYMAGQRVLVGVNSGANGLGDLGGRKVCATKTSTSLARIARAGSNPVPVSVDNWSDCLVMLQQGQVDAVSTDDTILAGMAAQDPTTKIVGGRFSEEPYGIGVPKGDEDMVRYVNAVLDQVRGGQWQASYDRWLAQRLGGASAPPATYR